MIEQAKALLDSLAITFDFPILEFIRNYLTCDALDRPCPISPCSGNGVPSGSPSP